MWAARDWSDLDAIVFINPGGALMLEAHSGLYRITWTPEHELTPGAKNTMSGYATKRVWYIVKPQGGEWTWSQPELSHARHEPLIVRVVFNPAHQDNTMPGV